MNTYATNEVRKGANTGKCLWVQLSNSCLSLQVIKVGTSSLVRPEQNTLNISNLARLCEVVRELKSQHHR